MIINGRSVVAQSNKTIDVISPLNGAVLTRIPDAQVTDIESAVAAASTTFNSGVWANMSPAARKAILL